MPRRAMRTLKGGETEALTQNYWATKAIVLDKYSTEEDIFRTRETLIPKLVEEELVYLYWELSYNSFRAQSLKDNGKLMKEYLLTEFMDRKYGRGEYKIDGKKD